MPQTNRHTTQVTLPLPLVRVRVRVKVQREKLCAPTAVYDALDSEISFV